MHGAQADREGIAEANELYWSSQLSVNQIAEQMDLSKGALYGMIRPLPAGLLCPECGGEAAYGNRTARDRGLVACPECEWAGDEDDAEIYGDDASPARSIPGATDAEAPPAAALDRGRNRVLMGGALLGAAAGLALVFWTRRR